MIYWIYGTDLTFTLNWWILLIGVISVVCDPYKCYFKNVISLRYVSGFNFRTKFLSNLHKRNSWPSNYNTLFKYIFRSVATVDYVIFWLETLLAYYIFVSTKGPSINDVREGGTRKTKKVVIFIQKISVTYTCWVSLFQNYMETNIGCWFVLKLYTWGYVVLDVH